MVLVPVGDEDSFYAVNIFYDIRVVGDNIVDTQEVVFWEFNPSIDNDNLILILNSVGVFTDFAQTAYGENTNFFFL